MWQFPTVTTSQQNHEEAPDLQEVLRRIWQLRAVNIIPLGLSTMEIIKKKLHNSFNCCILAWLYIHTESSNTHYMPYSLRVFSRIMNKKCLVSDPYSLKTSYTAVKFNSYFNPIQFNSCSLIRWFNIQMANYRNSTTYRNKLTKDNKKGKN